MATYITEITAQKAERQRLGNKSGEHRASRHSDAILQVNQTVWEKKQLHSDHGASNSHRRPSNKTQQYWRSSQRSDSTSSLGERPRNTDRPVLAGGGDPDESSSKKQGETSKKRERSEQQDTTYQWRHRGLRGLSVEELTQGLMQGSEHYTKEIEKQAREWQEYTSGKK